MITELTVLLLLIEQPTIQCLEVDYRLPEQVAVTDVMDAMVDDAPYKQPVIRKGSKHHIYKYLSMWHSKMAILRTGYKRTIYWKRIRSRTWKKKITSQLEVLTIILVVISVI